MAKIILSMDGTVLREVELTKERTTIGRKPHNDITIDNLAVSGEHARIVTILNDSFLEDLGSTNGTSVNGTAVKKHILQNNDLIEIGKFKLKYISEPSAAAGPGVADFEKTMVIRSPMAAAKSTDTGVSQMKTPEIVPPAPHMSTDVAPKMEATVPRPPQPQATAPVKLAAIQILTGASAGKELELTKTLTTLGKPGMQVAVITRRPQGYFVTHVEGANFPIVNGKSVSAQAHPLNDHDIIEIAGVKMEFFFKAS